MLSRAVALALLPLLLQALSGCRSDAGPSPGTGAPPVIYKWVDENGVSHYTSDRDRIPRSIRNRVPTRADAAATAATPPATAPEPELATDEVSREEWDAGESVESETATPEAAKAASPSATKGATASSGPPAAAQRDEGEQIPAANASAQSAASGAATASDTWAAMDRAPDLPAAKATLAGDADGPEASAARARAIADLDARIAALEADIAADEDSLKDLLSDASAPALSLGEDGELRTISERLPRLLAEVKSLRDQRGKLERP